MQEPESRATIDVKLSVDTEVKKWFDEHSADLSRDEVIRRALLLYHFSETIGAGGFRMVGLKEEGDQEEIVELPEGFFDPK